jgi:hypothetical protein
VLTRRHDFSDERRSGSVAAPSAVLTDSKHIGLNRNTTIQGGVLYFDTNGWLLVIIVGSQSLVFKA